MDVTMQKEETGIEGVYLLRPAPYMDKRGCFVKVFSHKDFDGIGLNFSCAELFYSSSFKDVIRGFHYQEPPFALEKVVWVTHGEIVDVVLDLRKRSLTYNQCFVTHLSEENRAVLYIPQGVAHAFGVLSDWATVLYASSQVFSPEHDAGVHWNSTHFRWPIINPIISERDQNLPPLDQFVTPF
jgi:dTDP-4-dehydrorhamnose 3,5-epimerase